MFDATTLIRSRTLFAGLIAAGLAAAACDAQARAGDFGVTATQTDEGDNTVTRTATVTAAGLDLTTAGGAASLHGRIEAAAERVCRLDSGDQYLDATSDDFSNCVARAAQGAQGWATAQIANAGASQLASAQAPAPGVRVAAADPSSH